MNLRVSVSRVDDFRKVVLTDYATEANLVRSIKEPFSLGWQAQWGTALHACIEDPEGTRRPDGSHAFLGETGASYVWPGEIVRACVESWPKGCVFERRLRRDYYVRGHNVVVSGRTDGTLGLFHVEGKTRFGTVYLDSYYQSLQWQFYLECTPWARGVEYRIHEIGGMKDEGGELHVVKGGPRLEEIHVFRVWREPGISRNCRYWLEEFIGWAESRGLLPFLGDKYAEPDKITQPDNSP